MALSDVFKSNTTKSITVVGAEASNVNHATYQAKCNQVVRNCDVVMQLERATVGIDDHIAGGKSITMTPALMGNCYWLPWRGWKAVTGQLQGACNYFVTANLTGCCVVVSGTTVSPYVTHINCQPGNADLVAYNGSIQEYNFDMAAAQDQFYGQVTAQLVASNVISDVGLQMLRPTDYGTKLAQGYAVPTSVFGIRTGGNWTIYYNVGKSGGPGITRQLFPVFQSL
jgi:hypothetical protein